MFETNQSMVDDESIILMKMKTPTKWQNVLLFLTSMKVFADENASLAIKSLDMGKKRGKKSVAKCSFNSKAVNLINVN